MAQELPDGSISFIGGQNAGILADRIREDQYAAGINVTTKDGGLGPRPGFAFQDVVVTTDGAVTNPDGTQTTYQRIFKSGKFQGAEAYITDVGRFIITVISGVIFMVDIDRLTAEVLDIEPQDNEVNAVESDSQRLNQYISRHNFSPAGRFFTVFDHPDFPVIIDGIDARRADPDAVDAQGNPTPEIPNGVIGAFNQSRLWVGSFINEFTAGDPVGNLATPDAPITFIEVLTPASAFFGQVFSLESSPLTAPITAMGFIHVADKSTENGPLFVATKDAIYAYRSDISRTQWEQGTFGSVVLFNAGIVGPKAFTHRGTDLLFVSGDGHVRSLALSAAQQGGRWVNSPIDREVKNWVVSHDTELNELTEVATAGNRVFITVNPYRVDVLDTNNKVTHDFAFRGLVVLELDNVSGMLQDAPPAWAGLWTGVNPMALVEVDDELYIWSKDPAAVNALYKLDESKTYDVYKGTIRPIRSRVYLREYSFQDRFKMKKEKTAEPQLSSLEGDVVLEVRRRTESAKNWTLWRRWEHRAKTQECECTCPEEMPVLLSQSFRDLVLGSPVETDYNPVTRDDLAYFKRLQFRLDITALNWKLEAFRALAELQPDEENLNVSCMKVTDKTVEKDCEDVDDWLIHSTPFSPRDEVQCL